MSLLEHAKKLGDKYLGEILLALSGLVVTAIAFFADEVLPSTLVEWLGPTAIGRIFLGMMLVIALLVAWVVYLHPRLRFDEETGVLFEVSTRNRICAKCKAEKRGRNRLERYGQSAWRCRICDSYYNDK